MPSNEEPNFHFYSRENAKNLALVNESTLSNTSFNHTLRTYLIIHGMSDTAEKPWILAIKNNLLQMENANLILVDWRRGARLFFNGWPYLTAARNTANIGLKTAQFLNASLIQHQNVHCIGNSLGAHVCAHIGSHVKLARITGLDPSRPFFSSQSAFRLHTSHAHFVDVIHTSSLGLQMSIGHSDFWPNGGSYQVGCFIDLECHHMRATKLYAESVLSTSKFRVDNFNRSMGHYAEIGREKKEEDERNNFYLKTNSHSPFSFS
jgi:hepatic triacylglycerol lipase